MPSVSVCYVDVLIIGAGPSGLMAAQALGRLGVQVKVVERREDGTLYGHADGLQPRTLEIWNSYGIADQIVSKGAAVNAIVTYASSPDGKVLLRSNPEKNIIVKTRYPFELGVSINDIEGTLRFAMKDSGTTIEHETIPTSIEMVSGNYPVKIMLKHTQHTKVQQSQRMSSEECVSTTYAKFVIGADGAYSWIRRNLNIAMVGDQTEYIWGVADVLVETDFPDVRLKAVIQASSGTLIVIPREHDKLRLYVQLSMKDIPTKLRFTSSEDQRDNCEALVLERARKALLPYVVEYKKVFWSTIFSVGQRVATRFSYANRIFIVGDACHTHSPKAAQGANAAMGDSHNLAWKIAYVLRKWGKPSLLDTYEEERRKFADELIEFDTEISNIINKGSAADYKKTLHKQNLFTSGVGISYLHSQLTQLLKSNSTARYLKCGERLPPCPLIRLADWNPLDIQDICPSDGLFKLYVFPGDINNETTQERLHLFSSKLQSFSGERGVVHERIHIYTILNGKKENTHWKSIPCYLLNYTWKWSYISSDPELTDGNIYHSFGIETLASSCGAAVLVRPDGYISTIGELNDTTARHVIAFIENL